ncbi:hypothetical protein TNCV_5003571 [Trichonephila clavipes]|nr:hypothetical protein TNCV_5003571 [Trichonephila clavipes]
MSSSTFTWHVSLTKVFLQSAGFFFGYDSLVTRDQLVKNSNPWAFENSSYRRIDACEILSGQSPHAVLPKSQSNRFVAGGHEFEPSIVEVPQCRRGRCALNLSMLNCSPVGVWGELEEDGDASQVSSSSLDYGSQLRGSSPTDLVQL